LIYLVSYACSLLAGTYFLGRDSALIGAIYFASHFIFPILYFASLREWIIRAAKIVSKPIASFVLKVVSPETYLRPTVTVIIPSHNCVKFLREAVDSALDSVGVRVTVLIIDDQSNDGSLELAKRLSEEDNRVQVVVNHKSRGAYFCRNIGLQLATTEFVAFLDSDDWQEQKRLQKQIAPMLRGKKIKATYCLTQRWSEDLLVPKQKELKLCHISPVFRRKTLDYVGYFDGVRFGADGEFRARLIALFGEESIPTINLQLYKARYRPNSLTSSGPGAHLSIQDGILTYTPNEIRYRYRDSYRFWHSQTNHPYVPFPLKQRMFSLDSAENNTSPFLGERVIAFMTLDSESGIQLKASLSSIASQVDELHIIIENEVRGLENWLPDNTNLYLLKDTQERSRFGTQLKEASGYVLLLDGSFIYPRDYVARMLTEIEIHNRKVIVGAKALIFPRDIETNRKRKSPIVIDEFRSSKGEWVDLLGSGTIGFHSQTFNLTDTHLRNTSTDNFDLARQALSANIPMLSIRRPKRWIRKSSGSIKDLLTRGKVPAISDEVTNQIRLSLGDQPRSLLVEKTHAR
jgi:glycosyltransferase involved in cell wall biosynthesis